MRRLRGTPLDPFGMARVRRVERAADRRVRAAGGEALARSRRTPTGPPWSSASSPTWCAATRTSSWRASSGSASAPQVLGEAPRGVPAGARAGTVDSLGAWTTSRSAATSRSGASGFGAMRITGAGIWGPPEDPDEAGAVLRRVLELGVNLIDTADSYGPEVSESLIAEALHPYPEGLVIATKGGLRRTGPGEWPRDARPERLKECCEGSLRRLKARSHRPLPAPLARPAGARSRTPSARSRSSRTRARSAISACPTCRSSELERGAASSWTSSRSRTASTSRTAHSEDVLDACDEAGIGFIPWFPLATGRLARPGGPLDEVARSHDATPGQVALAWLLARSDVMLPIPGHRVGRAPRGERGRRRPPAGRGRARADRRGRMT